MNRERVLPSYVAHKDVFIQRVGTSNIHAAVSPLGSGASLPDMVSLQFVSGFKYCIANSAMPTFLYSQRTTSGTRGSPSNSPISQELGLWTLSSYCSLQQHPKLRRRNRFWMESLFMALKIPPFAMRSALVPHQWATLTLLS